MIIRIISLFILGVVLGCTLAVVHTVYANNEFEQAVISGINGKRGDHGLNTLTHSPVLEAAARNHNELMNKCFDEHTEDVCFEHQIKVYDELNLLERARTVGYAGPVIGEVLALGYSTPDSAIEGWLNSPGHRAQLLNPEFTMVGCAYMLANDSSQVGSLWTCEFGAEKLSSIEPTPKSSNTPNPTSKPSSSPRPTPRPTIQVASRSAVVTKTTTPTAQEVIQQEQVLAVSRNEEFRQVVMAFGCQFWFCNPLQIADLDRNQLVDIFDYNLVVKHTQPGSNQQTFNWTWSFMPS